VIESPCNKVCVINEATGLCRGCYRTLDEISRWASYTSEQKFELLEELARRKARQPFPHHAQ